MRHLYALLAIVVGWVVFRAETFDQAGAFLEQMALLAPASPDAPGIWEHLTHQQLFFAAVGVIAATPLARSLLAYVVTDRNATTLRRATRGRVQTLVDVGFAFALILVCSIYIASGTYNPFIYFRF